MRFRGVIMIEKILMEIKKNKLINSGDNVLAAVSGGPDSMALLDVLNKIKKELNFSLAAAHLNHMFRGEEAEGDAKLVEEFCRNQGIPVTVEAINVNEYIKLTGLSPQVAAREVRYDFLNRTASREGCNKIALAHHGDDQIETILMNFLRGAGTKGLKGIDMTNRQYIRPFLFIRRLEIEEYCQRNNISWRLDSSNLKDIYLRNKIRHKLIPFLEQEFNPNLVEVLSQTANIIKDENAYIEVETKGVFNSLVVFESFTDVKKCLSFNNKSFTSLAMAVKRRLIIEIWTVLTGDNRDLDYRHIEKVIEFIQAGPSNGYINLPRGIYVIKEYDNIKLSNIIEEKSSAAFYMVMDVPGKIYIEELNITFEGRILSGKPNLMMKSNEIVIDLDKVSLPLIIRNRLPGDKVKLLGMQGSRKLKDLLIDLKIVKDKRSAIPLVFDQKGMIWVGGIRQCTGYEIDEKTSRYLKLSIKDEDKLI